MNTIVIDCGASFIKCALFRDGRLTKQIEYVSPKEEQKLFIPNKARGVLRAVKKGINELSCGINIANICISNEMHGFILVDTNFEPVTEYISWQFEYGNIPVLENKTSINLLCDTIGKLDLLYTGMPLRAGLPSSNLFYLKVSNNNEFVCSKERLYFLTLGDWILAAISRKLPHIHPTNAAATGLFDLRKNDWNWKLINEVSFNNIIFPPIGTAIIEFKMNNTLYRAAPAIGDQQASLLGTGLKTIHDLSFNLGTGGQVSVLNDTIFINSQYQTRPYFYGYYLKTIPHIPCGRALNVYIRFFQDILQSFGIQRSSSEIWDTILSLHDETNSLQFDLSFFENAITNYTCGSISGIKEYNFTLSNVINGILYQVATNAVSAAKYLCEDREIKRVLMSGGVARKSNKISEYIKNAFPNVEYVVAYDESLNGLNEYASIVF